MGQSLHYLFHTLDASKVKLNGYIFNKCTVGEYISVRRSTVFESHVWKSITNRSLICFQVLLLPMRLDFPSEEFKYASTRLKDSFSKAVSSSPSQATLRQSTYSRPPSPIEGREGNLFYLLLFLLLLLLLLLLPLLS